VKVSVVLLVVVTATLSAPSNAQVSQQSPQDATVMERGRYVIEIAAACGICHTTRGADGQLLPNMKLAGGRVIVDRGFRAVVPNITPDPDTGIGRWSDAEIAAAIREGRRTDGTLIGPVMPIALYRGLSDHDLMAMVAYLRAVLPVQHAVTERSTYPFQLTSYGPPVAGVPDPPEDDPVARGAYLAGPLAHCMDCHTPPLPGERRDWSRIGAGGVPFEVPGGVAVSRNITSSKEYGIKDWTDEQIIRVLTQGISADGRRLAPPMSGRASIWAQLTERDKHDLVAYLRSLPPEEQGLRLMAISRS
jgi:mono/diheme cytochrome c family protein